MTVADGRSTDLQGASRVKCDAFTFLVRGRVLVGCAVDAAPNTPSGDFTQLRPLPWFADGDAMKFG